MKILVADDDRTLVTIFKATFGHHGWEVVTAADAMQALMFSKQKPQPELILLDLGMPGGSGYDTLKRMKSHTLTKDIPVVVVSGTTDPEAPAKAKALGAAGFVKKPVEPEALAQAIERYFEKKG